MIGSTSARNCRYLSARFLIRSLRSPRDNVFCGSATAANDAARKTARAMPASVRFTSRLSSRGAARDVTERWRDDEEASGGPARPAALVEARAVARRAIQATGVR